VLIDARGRRIDYLRVSVTDRCNLRCVYCLPYEGVELKDHVDILSYEELERVIEVAVSMGIRTVRVTGGEPLVRKGIVGFLERISRLEGLRDLALTTNGQLLAAMAQDLKAAGVRRVNVSLDTLRPERYREVTRGGRLDRVLAGIEEALRVGLDPVKINVVVARGLNEDEIGDFIELARERPVHVRFIELMPLGEAERWGQDRHVTLAPVMEEIAASGEYEVARPTGSGPARYWRTAGGRGTIGFITALSRHFCGECNRLRLTAEGQLHPCLAAQTSVDLRAILRGGGNREELVAAFRRAVVLKPGGHDMSDGGKELRLMSRIGG